MDSALSQLDVIFDAMYSEAGCAARGFAEGLPADGFLFDPKRAQFCERMQYDTLFRWFLDLDIEDLACDQSTFAENRERLLEHDVSARLFAASREAKRRHLLSRDRFTLDGSLLEASAGHSHRSVVIQT